MKIKMAKEQLRAMSGDIDKLAQSDFDKLFNIVLFEKARREMVGLNTSSGYMWRAKFEAIGKVPRWANVPQKGVSVEPVSIEFKSEGMIRWSGE